MHWFRGSVERFGAVLQHELLSRGDVAIIGVLIEYLPRQPEGMRVDDIAKVLDAAPGRVEGGMAALCQTRLVEECAPGLYRLRASYAYLPSPTKRQAQRRKRAAARTVLRAAAEQLHAPAP